ncbi:MAG: hypothetical protein WCT04_21720 [Planctomycetota bacterium]
MILFNNPEFIRLVRSKLRTRTLITYLMTSFLLFGATIAISFAIEKSNSGRWSGGGAISFAKVFHGAFYAIVWIQLAAVSLYGVALAAQNVTLEKERITFDFQRLVAMGPVQLTIGKVLGAPAEAFFITLMGVPFALLACIGSDVSFSSFIHIEIVVLVFGVILSSFGIMCSSFVEKTNQATGVVMLFGFPFYIILGNWNSTSLWSTMNPIYLMREFSNKSFSMFVNTFHYCGMSLPLIVGFLFLSSLFLALFITITSRRIADTELALLTPKQGIIAFLIFQALLLGDASADITFTTIHYLQYFHGMNLLALIMLAFAMTPSAELVRGRVQREPRDRHWAVVLERSNPLQDSPSLRAMAEIGAIYILTSMIWLFVLNTKQLSVPGSIIPYSAALFTTMIASIGLAVAGMLLYIQVYTERGCFKIGGMLLLMALALPPLFMWIAIVANPSFPESHVLRISPIAYVLGIETLTRKGEGGEWICPSICVVLAGAFVVLSAMRIRFLLDVKDIVSKRTPAEPAQSLQDRMRVSKNAALERERGGK